MMRQIISIVSVFVFALTFVAISNAQLRLPRPSQGSSVTQTIGVTDITINYSRPAVKGRPIFGTFRPPTITLKAKRRWTTSTNAQRTW